MEPSRYNILTPNPQAEGETLIFNTLTGALYSLEPEYTQSLEALSNGGELGEDDQERLAEMAQEGFVVQSQAVERERALNHLRKMAYSAGDTAAAKVVTTLACNLDCEYCFESHMDRANTMSLEQAQMVVERLSEIAEDDSLPKIRIDFYGGEPLMNMEVIEYISKELQAWCQETGRDYGFTMTTNGTLLTKERVERLKPLGFLNARVTVDGVKEVHDARRPFRMGEGSPFDAIMANLDEVVDILPVTIITVHSEEDVDDYRRFLEDMAARNLLKRVKGFQFGVEMQYFDEEGQSCGGGHCDMTAGMAKTFLKGLDLLTERGIKQDVSLLTGGNCSLTTAAGVMLFTPDGYIHKCPLLIHQPQYATGVMGHKTPLPLNFDLINQELFVRCLDDTDCPYVPQCGTGIGCRVVALNKEGDLSGDACPKDFFDYYIPRAMALEQALAEE